VLSGVFVGACIGLAGANLGSPYFPIDGIIGAVVGMLFGSVIERRASQATGTSCWQRFWMWFPIVVVAPVCLYITITALGLKMWFPPRARE
jgi:hypothetical protein